jgi:hypothetical protein
MEQDGGEPDGRERAREAASREIVVMLTVRSTRPALP